MLLKLNFLDTFLFSIIIIFFLMPFLFIKIYLELLLFYTAVPAQIMIEQQVLYKIT